MPGAAGSLLLRWLRPRVHVEKTRILARFVEPKRQVLVYSMDLRVGAEVAMILPVPVVPGSGEHALDFVNLEGESDLFDRLDALFEQAPLPQKGGFRLAPPRQRLVVHEVGSFVASFVPTESDFDRLDPRFRLPLRLSDVVPAYRDYGFAVFQLKPGKVRVHPMAFTFETRAPRRLFFPTVHVHDGRMRPRAKFDHALYYQGGSALQADSVSDRPPRFDAKGALDTSAPVCRTKLRGDHANEDIWIDAS